MVDSTPSLPPFFLSPSIDFVEAELQIVDIRFVLTMAAKQIYKDESLGIFFDEVNDLTR